MPIRHPFSFDPTYGYSLPDLLAVVPPGEPSDFAPFWLNRYRQAIAVDPCPVVSGDGRFGHFELREITYRSTDGFSIGGWLLIPGNQPVRRGLVVGHGYGGRDGPDAELPLLDATYLFPCFRGLSRSRRSGISDNPAYHVLHDIQDRDRYILGGCVEDLWTGVSALLALFPEIRGHIGYAGISFGGGIGALALAFEQRVARGHLNVPTFGHQALRLSLPTLGSGEAVRRFEAEHGHVMDTLRYYDAASAARHIACPMHVAAARFDPCVAPPGQFAIYKALRSAKELYVLEAGHFDHPGRLADETELNRRLRRFFQPL